MEDEHLFLLSMLLPYHCYLPLRNCEAPGYKTEDTAVSKPENQVTEHKETGGQHYCLDVVHLYQESLACAYHVAGTIKRG